MLRPITTSSASAGSAPTAVHASAATTLPAHEARASSVAAAQSAQAQAASSSAEQMFLYNSFQFIYRQDIGRIVLIGQSPETGERVIQIPSEQVLRAYERTVRVERQARAQDGEPSQPASHVSTGTTTTSAPQLATALVAAVSGANHGSGVISVSA